MSEEFDKKLVREVSQALFDVAMEMVKKYGLAGHTVSVGNFEYARAAIKAVRKFDMEKNYDTKRD